MKQIQRIKEKLDQILSYHEELVEDLPSLEEFKENRVVRRGIEKTIELVADAIIDVAMMIISEEELAKPEDSRDAIGVLEKENLLTKKTAAQIKDLVSFRNLLVHRYIKIKEEQEYQSIEEEHEDIISFVKEIEEFIKKEEKAKKK